MKEGRKPLLLLSSLTAIRPDNSHSLSYSFPAIPFPVSPFRDMIIIVSKNWGRT